MLLRRRQSMRRTTSMTEFAVDFVVSDAEVSQTHPEQDNLTGLRDRLLPLQTRSAGTADWLEASYQGSGTRSSADFAVVEIARFLAECGLCNRRLGPDRDIFMYRYLRFFFLPVHEFWPAKSLFPLLLLLLAAFPG